MILAEPEWMLACAGSDVLTNPAQDAEQIQIWEGEDEE